MGILRTGYKQARNIGRTPNIGVPTLSDISRNIVSAAGGSLITLTGTNLDFVSVDVSGTDSTVVTRSPTSLSFTTPSKAVNSGYDVRVTNSSGSATLAGSLEYGPIITTTFAQADFEDLTTGGFTKSASASIVSTFAQSGSNSLLCSCGANTGSYLSKSFGNNPARAEANGCWTRFFIMMPQATIDSLVTGQAKLYLHRFGDFGAHPDDKHGIVLGFGAEFRGNDELAAFVDWNNGNTSGVNPITGTAFSSGNTGVPMVDGQWVEILQKEWHDGVTTGHMSIWINGKRCITDFQSANLFGNNVDSTGALATDSYGIRIGIAFTQNATTYPVDVYVDNAFAGNGVPV